MELWVHTRGVCTNVLVWVPSGGPYGTALAKEQDTEQIPSRPRRTTFPDHTSTAMRLPSRETFWEEQDHTGSEYVRA